ncbi:hypothetical protein [Elizabethkingia anophelis]|uniref:hypothetical protein n=1 Tax=Elizabethkingia anophelis TaxID=1117645 RepID=UPI003891B77B
MFKTVSIYKKVAKKEHNRISALQNDLKELQTRYNELLVGIAFRVGDEVYTDDDRFEINKPYYIIDLYGGLDYQCALIHESKDNFRRPLSCVHFGILLHKLSHKPFPSCPKCNKPL